jgi:H+/Cl- antiporter ClcA
MQRVLTAAWKQTMVGLGVGAGCGVGAAVFLALLDLATRTRQAHPGLLYGLPLYGLALGWATARWNAVGAKGTNLVLDTLHDGGAPLPARMGPFVLLGTVGTHLFGGSAGREGTAVQLGASYADQLARLLGWSGEARRWALVAGMAGGFGAVFGTPLAGGLFGLEVTAVGRMETAALLPALVAALVGDAVTRGLGVTHMAFLPLPALALTPALAAKWLVVAAAVAAAATGFIEAMHGLKQRLGAALPSPAVRALCGGLGVVLAGSLLGPDYLGLSTQLLPAALSDGPLPQWGFLAKLGLTALTLSAGFVGGEVTPLFVSGALLGHALAGPLGLPHDLAAAVCLAALFGTAAKTPVALTAMAVELFGANVGVHVALVSAAALVLSGQRGIYAAQRRVT